MTDEYDATPPSIQSLLTKEADLLQKARPGEVVLGGIFLQPHLSIGYACAARHLLSADAKKPHTFLPPIFYLVRHAVELALKDLLIAYHQNEIDQQRIDEYDGVPTNAKPLSETRRREIARTHDLRRILEWVFEVMPAYVQPNWKLLVQHIESHEKGAPEWSRYETVRDRKNKSGPMVPSYRVPQIVAIEALVGELDLFIQQAAEITSEPQKDGDISALEELGLVAQHLAQHLYSRGLL
ncbi:hypothetical protein [Cystobacter ferrugineus]|uniref:Uncharacterized protein n=1 Tax=Cystobacter ferrugineus TaxID=83449 RepID=A0A1L9B6M2_9BACT|nr:hypothetical protein [Cystobacter ferrugineus]OJH37919.1 hypothetical protein BON30_27565 [Cystobacter ferrugineus]